MISDAKAANNRILVIDDNPKIHEDFRSILCNRDARDRAMDETEAALFDLKTEEIDAPSFEIESAFQGQEGLEKVRLAVEGGQPHAMAFVDVRMPPGWDGVETISQIWRVYPDLQVVICTAYADYSWDEIVRKPGQSENLVILRKPFDNIEVLQLAHALTRKWFLGQQARVKLEDLDKMVSVRTQELELANQTLQKEVVERRAAQDALLASRDNLFEIFNSINTAIFIHGVDGKLLAVNRKMLDMYRMDPERACRLSIKEDYSDPSNPWDRLPSIWERVLAGEPHFMEWLARRPQDRTTFPVEVYLRKVTWDGDDAIMAMVSDLTEKKSLQAQLLRAQRLESIGTLASGIAHDLNNILAPIMLSAQLLQLQKPGDKEREILTTIQTSAQRGAEIVKQVLTFARGVDGQRAPLQPRYLIKEIHKMTEKTFPKNVTVRSEVAKDLWTVTGDATQLHQVLLHLCVNARDAMASGGELVVSAENVNVTKPNSSLFADGQAGPHVLIRVSDTGQGIPPAILEKIFEPFFTTKEPGKGTGLGLSTLLGIVRSHGGFVDVQSELGRGSTFNIYLPAKPGEAAPRAQSTTSASPRGSGECILVVDDESSVCSVTSRTLVQHGYKVLVASNGREALRLVLNHSTGVRAVVTDVMMPVMDGLALVQALRHSHPQMPVIACTGLVPDGVQQQLEELGVAAFLVKPYPVETLLSSLRDCLKPAQSAALDAEPGPLTATDASRAMGV